MIADDPDQWMNKQPARRETKDPSRLGTSDEHTAWDYDYLRGMLEMLYEDTTDEITKRRIGIALRDSPRQTTYREK